MKRARISQNEDNAFLRLRNISFSFCGPEGSFMSARCGVRADRLLGDSLEGRQPRRIFGWNMATDSPVQLSLELSPQALSQRCLDLFRKACGSGNPVYPREAGLPSPSRHHDRLADRAAPSSV